MPQGAAVSEGSSGEMINHFAAIRMRVVGNGSLLMAVYSLDDVRSKTLVPFTMQATNRRQPTRIVNFMENRASFELSTEESGEYFRINRIIIFAKSVFTSYPGS